MCLCFYLFYFGVLQETLLGSSWALMANETKQDLETKLQCCGLFNSTQTQTQFETDLASCPVVRFRSWCSWVLSKCRY